MNWLPSALLALLLALPAGQLVQLCNHESGQAHRFVGAFCDGTLAHQRPADARLPHDDHGDDHDHGHGHSDAHSQHASPGEHHEPCSHEFISTGDDLARVYASASSAPDLSATLLPLERLGFNPSEPSAASLLSEPRTRGPPGPDDPRRHFTSCVRLTL